MEGDASVRTEAEMLDVVGKARKCRETFLRGGRLERGLGKMATSRTNSALERLFRLRHSG